MSACVVAVATGVIRNETMDSHCLQAATADAQLYAVPCTDRLYSSAK